MNDITATCISDLSKSLNQAVPVSELRDMFCFRCKNPDCVNAKWDRDKFTQRIQTQEQRLLYPEQADTNLPQFQSIAKQKFQNLLQKAMAIEINSKNWTNPAQKKPNDITGSTEIIQSPNISENPLSQSPKSVVKGNVPRTKGIVVDNADSVPTAHPWALKKNTDNKVVKFDKDGKIT